MSEPYEKGDTVVVVGDDFTIKGKIRCIYKEGDFDVSFRVCTDYDQDVTVDPDVHVVSKVEPEPPTLKHGDILTSGDENRVVIGDEIHYRSAGTLHVETAQRLVNIGSLKVIGNVFDLADPQ